jgi:hypothetical protein
MRYISGGSLEDLLRDGPLELAQVLRIGDQIAAALDHAHAQNVIHLDLKPANIMLDSARWPYVGDFGLAAELDEAGRAWNPGSGTLLYMAPEQLTSDVIGRQVDVYSFGIVLFHMITGALPFRGESPLAVRQLQAGGALPEISDARAAVPVGVNTVLRRATSPDPEARPTTLAEIMGALHDLLGIRASGPALSPETAGLDPALREAVDLYRSARAAWAGGQGRFLLGVTDFMVMADVYRDAAELGLQTDTAGRQMLLRGALEHGYDLDVWWAAQDEDNRRWVCLHAVRSAVPATRERAFQLLRRVPAGAERAAVIRLVGEALEIETDRDAALAALDLLAILAEGDSQQLDEAASASVPLAGSLLTRLAIGGAQRAYWRGPVWSEEVDLALGRLALGQGPPGSAEAAARLIGHTGCLKAARHVALEQRRGVPGALKALALIRDTAPALPAEVAPQARFYAWLTNSARRLTEHPMRVVWRFLLVVLAAWIAMGQHVYITFRSQALFTPQRWANAIAIGLVFGVLMGALTIVANEMPWRLRGFWPRVGRLAAAILIGMPLAIATWAAFTWLFLQRVPDWEIMLLGGIGLAFGLITTALLEIRGWRAFAIIAIGIYLPVYATFYNFCQQAWICTTEAGEAIAPFNFTPVILIGALAGLLFRGLRRPADEARAPGRFALLAAVAAGLLWAAGADVVVAAIVERGALSWGMVSALFVASFGTMALIGTVAPGRVVLALGSSALLAGTALQLTRWAAITPPLPADGALLYYDFSAQIVTVALPFALVIALGVTARGILAHTLRAIGEGQALQRGLAWPTAIQYYAFYGGLFLAVMALFSAHADGPLALFWSAAGLWSALSALAMWRGRRWGGAALVIGGVIMTLAGAAMDLRVAAGGLAPGAALMWPLLALLAVVLIAAAGLRQLWAAIALIAAGLVWLLMALVPDAFTSLALLGLIHTGLAVYALAITWPRATVAQAGEGTPGSELAQDPATRSSVIAPTIRVPRAQPGSLFPDAAAAARARGLTDAYEFEQEQAAARQQPALLVPPGVPLMPTIDLRGPAVPVTDTAVLAADEPGPPYAAADMPVGPDTLVLPEMPEAMAADSEERPTAAVPRGAVARRPRFGIRLDAPAESDAHLTEDAPGDDTPQE